MLTTNSPALQQESAAKQYMMAAAVHHSKTKTPHPHMGGGEAAPLYGYIGYTLVRCQDSASKHPAPG